MSRKQELVAEMTEAQTKYSTAAKELKAIQAEEQAARQLEKYKDYKFKVLWYGVPADKIAAVEPDDYNSAGMSGYGLPVVQERDYSYLLLKTEEELPRLQELMRRIAAVKELTAENKEPRKVEAALKLHKVILGEVDDQDSTKVADSV